MKKEWRHKDTLHLTLKKKWFDIMVSGEKKVEIRKPSKWLMSRIYRTTYDKVRFTNGYGKNAPSFTANYMGYGTQVQTQTHSFGSEVVESNPGDIIIFIGKILKVENYDTKTPTF